MTDWVYGMRPVMETLEGDPEGALRLWVSSRRKKGLDKITAAARKAKIKISPISPEELDERSRGGNHQGLALEVRPFQYVGFDHWLASASRDRAEGVDPLVLILDQVQDPMNLGAIIRSAAAFGVEAVIIPERRASPVTPTAVRSSAGMARKVPVIRVGNLSRTIERLKAEGFWVAGAATRSGRSPWQVDLKGPVALVMGSEHSGIRRLVAKGCDHHLTLPLMEGVESLNVSAAAAMLIYEVRRQQGWTGRKVQ